jgi:thiosulfate/3-mercaptopyruvate sulfurtransferase
VNGPLVSPGELAAMLAHPGGQPAVLDVRWALGGPPGREEYLAGHIPGAAFVDLDRDLAAPAGLEGRHPLPHPQAFAGAMRRAGVSAGRPVAVYDAAASMAAARAWWLLRYFGHRDVWVLDGGLAAWIGTGQPVETGSAVIEPGDFEAAAGRMALLDADGAADLARRGVLLDARAPERFRGEHEPLDPVAGHIPGACNRPTAENVDGTGRFLSPQLLRDGFAQVGAGERVRIGAYCGSGVTAAHEVLALELAGLGGALYVGSWSEWITDPSRPVATGG